MWTEEHDIDDQSDVPVQRDLWKRLGNFRDAARRPPECYAAVVIGAVDACGFDADDDPRRLAVHISAAPT